MLTLTCKLKFPDGASVTARVEAESADAEYPVTYEGAVERLPKPPQKCDAAYLEFIWKNWASKLGAELQIRKQGQYDRWAE